MFLIDLTRCLIICSLFRLISSHSSRFNLQFHWNSSNPFFQKSGFLTVYLGDLIDFLCPHYPSNHEEKSIEYNTLYLVNEEDYHRCQTVDYQPLLICNKPLDSARLIYTLSVSKYLPYPNVPEFDVGQMYYFISTSSGLFSQIDQRHDGLCRTKNFKLVLNVERYYRHFYVEEQNWFRPIVAKRTNLTFVDPLEHLFSSFSIRTSHSFVFIVILLVTCFVLFV